MPSAQMARKDLRTVSNILKMAKLSDVEPNFVPKQPMLPAAFRHAVKFNDITRAAPTRFNCREASVSLSRHLSKKEQTRLWKAWFDAGERSGHGLEPPTPSGALWLTGMGTGHRYDPKALGQDRLIYRYNSDLRHL